MLLCCSISTIQAKKLAHGLPPNPHLVVTVKTSLHEECKRLIYILNNYMANFLTICSVYKRRNNSKA